MPLRFSSLQRRRGLLFNFVILVFLVVFAVAIIVSTRCQFQTACPPSGAADDKWLSLWGLRSPSEEEGWSSIDDGQKSAARKGEEDVSGPAYCPPCGPGDALCAKYGYVNLASSECTGFSPVDRSHNLARSIAYEGSAARLRSVMQNAAQGRPTRIGVLGVCAQYSIHVLF